MSKLCTFGIGMTLVALATLVLAVASCNGPVGERAAPSSAATAPATADRASAAPATSPQRAAYECQWASEPVEIDGKADEQAWALAQVVDHFYLPWLGKNARPAKAATRARLLWDREYLYFFADMDDADLCADVKEHDGTVWLDDAFELLFKPAADKPGYYEFEVNPANTVLDMFLPKRADVGSYDRHPLLGDGVPHLLRPHPHHPRPGRHQGRADLAGYGLSFSRASTSRLMHSYVAVCVTPLIGSTGIG